MKSVLFHFWFVSYNWSLELGIWNFVRRYTANINSHYVWNVCYVNFHKYDDGANHWSYVQRFLREQNLYLSNIFCKRDDDNHNHNRNTQWPSVHIDCVSPINILKNKMKSVAFVLKSYSIYWQEGRSENESSTSSRQPTIRFASHFLHTCERGSN
jgi:hypothetical protein